MRKGKRLDRGKSRNHDELVGVKRKKQDPTRTPKKTQSSSSAAASTSSPGWDKVIDQKSRRIMIAVAYIDLGRLTLPSVLDSFLSFALIYEKVVRGWWKEEGKGVWNKGTVLHITSPIDCLNCLNGGRPVDPLQQSIK